MQNSKLILILCFSVLLVNVLYANAQEPQFATFRESAQVLVDQVKNQEATASIALLTTSTQEMRVPAELEQKIRSTDRLLAVIITSEENCILGVEDEICVLINFSREGIEGGIKAIQDKGREIGDSLIDDINDAFDLDAKRHSVYIHMEDTLNRALDSSEIIFGRGVVSAVYTMPKGDTSTFYEKMTAMLLPKPIRDAGGFLEIGKKMSAEKNSALSFTIIPQDGLSLYNLKVSAIFPVNEESIRSLDPLEFFKTEKLEKSDYFSGGFYPVNSLFHFVILTNEPLKVDTVNSDIVPITKKGGERIPSDLTKKGWFFDSDSGTIIEGKYLFGTDTVVNKNELVITLTSFEEPPSQEDSFISIAAGIDESLFILIAIAVISAVVVVYYLKGYRKKG